MTMMMTATKYIHYIQQCIKYKIQKKNISILYLRLVEVVTIMTNIYLSAVLIICLLSYLISRHNYDY